ncbi:MAG: uracil-DNA glycosylase [Burkholderiales bacterium]
MFNTVHLPPVALSCVAKAARRRFNADCLGVMKTPLSAFVDRIRAEQQLGIEVPDFDPGNGNEVAKYLFVLEAPGPKAVETGFISFENPDQTARNFRQQLGLAQICRNDIVVWNIVPWYVGNDAMTQIRAVQRDEITLGTQYLLQLLKLLPNLRCIVLVGGAARRAHVPLSAATTARILSCHHPSPRAMNLQPAARTENVEVFRFMRLSTA